MDRGITGQLLANAPATRDHGEAMVELSACAREPIQIPGSIQPHGVLFVLRPSDLKITQVSENLRELLGHGAAEALDQPIETFVGEAIARKLGEAALVRGRPNCLGSIQARVAGSERSFDAIAHRIDEAIVLELEPAPDQSPDLYRLLDQFTLRAEAATTVDQLCALTAEEIARLTGFDRVLIYRFDPVWNGTVIGEHSNGRLPSYLHHRFPAADIPAQARELYRHNRLRLIPDADYRPVPLTPVNHPETGQPLDMSFATLRSVSPVHVQYMKNMQTAASMSVSILRDEQLWGLISCHHHQPRVVPFAIRGVCDLFARAFSLRLAALEQHQGYERRVEVHATYAQLVERMADGPDFVAALEQNQGLLLALTGAAGAAVVTEQAECLLIGQTPTQQHVCELSDWLFHTVKQDVYHTDALASVYPAAATMQDQASGLLAISVSKLHPSYVLWFRPEIIQTIRWGGDPRVSAHTHGERSELHPRASFATWRETVRQRALAWTPSEIEIAAELRNALVGTVLRRAEELAELNVELTRSNRELEAFSYSVSHDLRAPLRHIVGFAEMLIDSGAQVLPERERHWLENIRDSSQYASLLVDKLLGYSRLGRAELQLSQVDLNLLVEEVRQDVMRDADGRQINWKVAELPVVTADLMMLRMAVRDLISNAVKYTRNQAIAEIEIGSQRDSGEVVFYVKDNGVGFDMQFANKLFGVFQRLHRWEDYEGTGIGLANVRRVIERHGGRTWAQAEVNQGAAFFFSLPSSSAASRRAQTNA